jgi:hypothetical protein
MSSGGGITFKDVTNAVEFLVQQDKPVNIAAIRRVLGRGSHQRIKMLWGLINEPEVKRLTVMSALDAEIAIILSENSTKNAGVQGQLVEALDAVNQLQEQMEDAFTRVARVVSLAQTVIMVNLNDISEVSDLQSKLKQEITELKYMFEHRRIE